MRREGTKRERTRKGEKGNDEKEKIHDGIRKRKEMETIRK
jgi:hypothetical protein